MYLLIFCEITLEHLTFDFEHSSSKCHAYFEQTKKHNNLYLTFSLFMVFLLTFLYMSYGIF